MVASRVLTNIGFLGDRKYTISAWDVEHNPYLMAWADVHERATRSRAKWRTSNYDPNNYSIEDLELVQRSKFTAQYGFAIPDERALRAIIAASPNGILEVGAGCGYWASLLTLLGADVVAVDPLKDKFSFDYTRNESVAFSASYFSVERITGLDAIKKYGTSRTLLMCWPNYRSKWPTTVLKRYLSAGGMCVAYVGESYGGCTASDSFYHVLKQTRFSIAHEYEIPQWEAIHDYLTIYKR